MDDAKTKIALLASGMIDGSLNYLESCVELASLRFEVGAYENDPVFFAFVAALSEIDSLSVDTNKQGWSALALSINEEKYLQSEAWVKKHTLVHCHALLKRYRSC